MSSTHGWATGWAWMAGLSLLAMGGCAQSGVGDPCIPESIPCSTNPETGLEECGYEQSESYIEASSVQCRTRVCVVHQLNGDPREICQSADNPDGVTTDNCVSEQDLDNKVYCSCRCRAPEDVEGNFELCSCPSGFICEDLLAKGGDGIRGGYCVKDLSEFGEE